MLVFLVDNDMSYEDHAVWIVTAPDELHTVENDIALVLPWLVPGESPELIGFARNWHSSPDYEPGYGCDTLEEVVKGYWTEPLQRWEWSTDEQKSISVTAPLDIQEAGQRILKWIPEDCLPSAHDDAPKEQPEFLREIWDAFRDRCRRRDAGPAK